MLRDAPFLNGEYYHIFNRGAHKLPIFESAGDYERFLLLALLANTAEPIVVRDVLSKYKGRSFEDVFDEKLPKNQLVDILAYSLMPNHFHFVLHQKIDNGITTFMKKLGTGYSMYFNLKQNHSGVLFQGRFKSRHVGNEPYFRYIFSYVHLNPVALIEPKWEQRGIKNPANVRTFMEQYPYSSYFDYSVCERPQSKLLSLEAAPAFLKELNDLDVMLKNTKDGPL